MAIQPTPPIQLDPSMDKGHELAFINQNFNNIASVLGQNSFVIVSTGTYTTTSAFSTISTPTGGHVTESFSHGLSAIPVVMAYLVANSAYYTLPYFNFSESATYQGQTITVSSDATKIYFTLATYNQGVSWGSTAIKYFILQQTAN